MSLGTTLAGLALMGLGMAQKKKATSAYGLYDKLTRASNEAADLAQLVEFTPRQRKVLLSLSNSLAKDAGKIRQIAMK